MPVSPIEIDGTEYLVSPIRRDVVGAQRQGQPQRHLRHGSNDRRDSARPRPRQRCSGGRGAAYYERESYASQYMDVPENPTVDDFAAKAALFPVFEVGNEPTDARSLYFVPGSRKAMPLGDDPQGDRSGARHLRTRHLRPARRPPIPSPIR